MKKSCFSTFNRNKINQGFTLIELIVVIIVIGVLSVTVLPKFFSSKGYQEYTYQAQIISALRNIQLRAMQQSHTVNCHQVVITATRLADNCNKSVVQVEAGHSVTITSANSTFTFDKNGKAASAIDVVITGMQALTVRIESEGYIHAI